MGKTRFLKNNKSRPEERRLLTNEIIISWLEIRFVERELYDKTVYHANIQQLKNLIQNEE
jgi:hypothetical protein